MSATVSRDERAATYKVPVRAVGGDGDVGGGTIDHMVAVGMNGIVGPLGEIHYGGVV